MYDSFTYTVLVVLEDLGFAPKGEGGAFVTDNGGNLRLGGALPTNTDGGGLVGDASRHARAVPVVRGDAPAPRRGRRQPGRRAPRSRSRTAAAVGCRRRRRSCSARRGTDARLATNGPRLERRPEVADAAARRTRTASSGKARAAASCASSTARPAACTSTTPGMLCSHCGKRDARVGDRERRRHRLLVHRHPPERRAAVQRADAVRGRDRRPRRGRRPCDRGDARPRPGRRADRHAGAAPTFRPAGDELGFVDFAAAAR